MRRLATVRKIEEVRAIEGADRIVAYRVGGWWVVDRPEVYQVGDLAIYLEVDSWVPHRLAPFLSKGNEPREYNGIKGERLRTVKLRGQISQGLLLPLTVLPDGVEAQVEADYAELLGISKYEKPLDMRLSGDIKGSFPSMISKTDQERVQNLTDNLSGWYHDAVDFEVTEKLDGSSCTVYFYEGTVGVCSRNMELKDTGSNAFWHAARIQGLIELLTSLGQNIALQGELIGPRIQKNHYRLTEPTFYLYDVFDINSHSYWAPLQRQVFASENNILHVPVLSLSETLVSDQVDDLLERAEGRSELNSQVHREGIVLKANQNPDIHFKAISNRWLLKNE